MKKKTKWIICGVVGVLVLGSLLGGGDPEQTEKRNQEYYDKVAEMAEAEANKNVLMEASIHEAPVMNGAGTEAIGEYLYIEVNKDDLTSLSQEEFKEFADEVVKDSGYNYATIIAMDTGEAILFPSCMTEIVQYGTLNSDGTLKNVLGYITLQEDDTYLYESK